MRIAHLLVCVFLLIGLLLLGSRVWQVGLTGLLASELPRRGLVDGALDLARNCFWAAAHGGLGHLLPKESMGWHLGL
jgi:hypothetical protein